MYSLSTVLTEVVSVFAAGGESASMEAVTSTSMSAVLTSGTGWCGCGVGFTAVAVAVAKG